MAEFDLRKFADINMKQLDLKSTGILEDDILQIENMTKISFLNSIKLMLEFSHSEKNEAYVLPNISNVLNEKDEKIEASILNNIKLYQPQATMLKRMLDIEEFDNLRDIGKYHGYNQLQSNLGIISERFSFGKTFMFPVLFKLKFKPNFVETPDMMQLYILPDKYKTHVNSNLVVCGNKTIKVWTENLKRLGLDYQKVSTAKDLDLIETQTVKEVILIKDGFTTWKGEKKYTLDHFSDLTRDKYFNRLIIDDFDMLKLNPATVLPESIFTWLISSTCEKSFKSNNIKGSLGFVCRTMVLFNFYFNLKCNADYSAVEFNIPNIDYYYTPLRLDELVINIMMNSAPRDNKYNDQADVFLSTKIDAPYIYDANKLKILISCENKEKRIELSKKIPNSILFDGRNIHKFGELNNQIGICGLIHGVNMGYLTHILIDSEGYTDSQVNQIVGRAQRIGRTQNLQVYIREPFE